MPGLIDVLKEIADLVSDRAEAERRIRMQFAGERVYIPPPDSRKDPHRAERIRELSRTLPTAVVAARLSVSHGYVRRLVRRKQ